MSTDAIVMLRDDHKAVKKLFTTLKGHDVSVVPDICRELTVHAEIEETIFYPAVRECIDMLDVNEAYEEHGVAKTLIAELSAMDPSDDYYEAKAVVLMEMVEHHIEEEEGEMFPEVREAFGRNRLQELGEQMADAKARVQADAPVVSPAVASKDRITVG